MNYQLMTVGGRHVYDCVGVGFGPSNISLAIAMEEQGLLENCVFLEKGNKITWHPGMLIPGTDIQHNPLRDLVTPRNPSSKYGFLPYLKAKDRLFEFLNLAAHYPPRSEYEGYVRWVGGHFIDRVCLSTEVKSVTYESRQGDAKLFRISLSTGEYLLARTVSFAPGRSNNIPCVFKNIDPEKLVHLTGYLPAKERWLSEKTDLEVLVIGGSQSAAEIILDLLSSPSVARVTCLSRGFGFKQKDLSPFTEEIYYPEFTNYYHSLRTASQNDVMRDLWRSNYGAADPDVIEALNLQLYEQMVTGTDRLSIISNSEVVEASHDELSRKVVLSTRERNNGEASRYTADAVILATGFKNFGDGDAQEPIHPLLSQLSDASAIREDGGIEIERDYRLSLKPGENRPPLFVNGLSESTHGFGDAGSFSLLSMRSAMIANAIRDHLSPPISIQQIDEIADAI